MEQAPEKEQPDDLGYRLLSPGGAGGSWGPVACHLTQVSSLASLNVLPVPSAVQPAALGIQFPMQRADMAPELLGRPMLRSPM